MGTIESIACDYVLAHKKHFIGLKRVKHIRKLAFSNAGVFTNNIKEFHRFVDIYLDSIKHLDIGLKWIAPMEDYFFGRYPMNRIELFYWAVMRPMYFNDPWTGALSNKKVLVISPFAETIEAQYKKRELLYDNKRILPKFYLKTYKALNTIEGENIKFNNWEEALNKQIQDILKIDFDIALIGCGAYAMPIGSAIKQAGKGAIVMCSSLQILFGIYGNTVGKNEYQKFGNKYWTRPQNKERPNNYLSVENSRYW